MELKRTFDLIGAVFGLIVLSPLLLVIAFFVRIQLGSPVIFTQQRPGLHGKTFRIYKFRTMSDKRDAHGNRLPDNLRLTKLGVLLRSKSLDELPSLLNVLKGEMSFVGPRPLLMQYLPLYSPDQARRHNVRPGITGWAQINGRQTVKFSKRFEYDTWYVDNWSFVLDLKILFRTVFRVSSGDGVISGQDVLEVDDLGFNEKSTNNKKD